MSGYLAAEMGPAGHINDWYQEKETWYLAGDMGPASNIGKL